MSTKRTITHKQSQCLQMYFDFNHLKKINSGYFQHLFIALYLVTLLFCAAIIGLIHAFIPFLFPFTPYNLSKKVVKYTENYFVIGGK